MLHVSTFKNTVSKGVFQNVQIIIHLLHCLKAIVLVCDF